MARGRGDGVGVVRWARLEAHGLGPRILERLQGESLDLVCQPAVPLPTPRRGEGRWVTLEEEESVDGLAQGRLEAMGHGQLGRLPEQPGPAPAHLARTLSQARPGLAQETPQGIPPQHPTDHEATQEP